ncbi:OmpA family protein [Arenibacter aquaticus]|uniref:OmpA family protein n=1 Tax=Arenibacter aquaticus TaxID=2489054 RepID=A0A430JY15_9FLAO|nr:OmpA family protein [Arenibacter aquaticus]RTE51710.1 OmpA family protein [Arenibacter aquaticus]
MKIYRLILVVLWMISFNINSAQELRMSSKDYTVTSSWMLGLGYNFVDDSGYRGEGLFDFKENWNAVAFPSRVSIGRYFESGLGFEGIITYNKYKVGKIINGAVNSVETDYLAFDTRLSYDLNKIIGDTGFFDPYVGVGLGYADVNDEFTGTYNAVVGFRTWFSDRFGLDINSSGKWGMGSGAGNHLQHAVGVVYRLGIEKGLSGKGIKKLARINEAQRKTDSINAAKKAEEEARLRAEQLAREQEQARLAAQDKGKSEAEKRTAIEKQLKEIGMVHFDLNSSYLGKADKQRLDKLADILKANPRLSLKVNSHADSRGTDEYNMWLSKRRVKRTILYLVEEKGIDASRLQGEGFGETRLLVEPDATEQNPEAKHKINRRSDFEIIDF